MNEQSQMQQSTIFQDSGAGPPVAFVDSAASLDPQTSLEDYNRTMLEYTQRQMSTFVDLDGSRGNGASSRSSQSSGNSGNSGTSSNGVLAGSANGPPPPTSASSSADAPRSGNQKYSKTPRPAPGQDPSLY
ncbi:hypothetical protein N7478_005693 [Penicillium angulare]|uniref:uncharacterized protein n=1 Tax=Penicillium angulare TaxID=116970 RepID=UPI00253FD8E2|nr:uncharacterized protein N7478_005693 [Penicillium angulare]KAJ5280321.1 hypothetical protein N7478_005693 [Penicillium angulare]